MAWEDIKTQSINPALPFQDAPRWAGVTLKGPEEEGRYTTFQQGFPLLNHLKEEPCFGFSPALHSDNF